VARAGDLEGGERLARRAAEQAAKVDFFWIKGLVFSAFRKTLALADKRAEAVEAFETALRLYEGKGDATSAAQIASCSFRSPPDRHRCVRPRGRA